MKNIELSPIGFAYIKNKKEVPRHWSISELEGTLVIHESYREGLKDITPGQRIVVLFHFHRSPDFTPEFLTQTPPPLTEGRGVFSLCSPIRPNPIGMSILEVLDIEGSIIHVKGIDMFDGTPILDIKPHVDAAQTAHSR